MNSRTLVITLGQLRAHQLTWFNFKRNVLDELNADLAVCVPDDKVLDLSNPYLVNARFRWLFPFREDLSDIFDQIQRTIVPQHDWVAGQPPDWPVLTDVPGHWLGGIAASKQTLRVALQIALRWFAWDNIRAARLDEAYDRFIITRSDFFYSAPHPPLHLLDTEALWIPDGEDYGGICDRHVVVSPEFLGDSCNFIEPMLRSPVELRAQMLARDHDWNHEKLWRMQIERHAMKVKRFPYIMFLVRQPDDPTSTTNGHFITDLGMTVKYRSEFFEAERYRDVIASDEDWAGYFQCQASTTSLPQRIYTCHRSVVHVDATSKTLRHSPIKSAPAGADFVFGGDGDFFHVGRNDQLEALSLSAESGELKVVEPGAASHAEVKLARRDIAVALWPDVAGSTNNLIALNDGTHYLTAEPGGHMLLNRANCETWEKFRVIPQWKRLVHQHDTAESLSNA